MANSVARRQRLERELRGLLVLELVQVTIAFLALGGLAVRTVVLSTESATTMLVTGVLVAAVVHLALAARTRMGIGDVRRELLSVGSTSPSRERGHPYREPQRWS